MNKAVLISINPKWVEMILNGKKTVEVRKTAPKLKTPFKCYIYCTKNKDVHDLLEIHKDGKIKKANGKVVAEFTCNQVERFTVGSLRSDDIEDMACISFEEICKYFYKPGECDGRTAKEGCAWHIADLKVYDQPKELSEFVYYCDTGKNQCGEGCKCYKCGHQVLSSVGVIDGNIQAEHHCEIELTRPPQSWCYVEEK